jgi:hypothetical protein
MDVPPQDSELSALLDLQLEPQPRAYPDQQRAPRHERARDQIAELLVGSDHGAQLLDAERDHLAVLSGNRRHVGRLPGHEIRPAPEAARADHAD